MLTTLKTAIDDSIAQQTLTPEFVDCVWRIGVTCCKNNPEWLCRIDWEGAIQDTLIEYLDLESLPVGYDKPNHAIAQRLQYHFRHACWEEKVNSGRNHAWLIRGEKTTKQGTQHQYRRKKREGKKWKGTQYSKKSRRWRARLWVNGQDTTIGWYGTEAEAGMAYLKAVEGI